MKKNMTKLALVAAFMTAGLAASAFGQAEALKPTQIEKEKIVQEGEKAVKTLTDDVKVTIENMKSAKKFEFGKIAPDFELVDSAGKKHVLSEYVAQGHVVVLEWFNPQCPYVVEHYNTEGKGTSNTVEKEFADQKVTWLRINSGSEQSKTSGKEYTEQIRKDWKIASPVLLDMDGKVGKAYGAKVTPEMFVIGRDGVVAYHGAFDSDPSPSKTGEVIYVRDAVRSVLAGETVAKGQTKAVGCGVKYAPEKKKD